MSAVAAPHNLVILHHAHEQAGMDVVIREQLHGGALTGAELDG
jgi:hypothetical protein